MRMEDAKLLARAAWRWFDQYPMRTWNPPRGG
jgi:hypothetical protein